MLYAVPQSLDPERLADLARFVQRVRVSARLSVDGAAAKAPMSAVTWTKVERGEPVRSLTYAGVERVLGWPQGAIDAYLDEGAMPPGVEAELARQPQDDGEQRLLAKLDQVAERVGKAVPAKVRDRMLTRYRARMNEARERTLADLESDLEWVTEQQRDVG